VVYEIAPRDERLQPLPVPAEQPLQALYGASPEQLLVVERDADQRTRLSLFDRSAQPWRRLASIDGVSQARFDRSSGRVLFTRLAPVACGRWMPRCRRPACSRSAMTGPAAGDTGPGPWPATRHRVPRHLDHVWHHLRAHPARPREPERCLDAERLSAGNGLSASADGRDLFVAMAVSDGADIGVMRLPERPRAVPGVLQVVVVQGNGPS
jgi:hypothetical protein